MRNNPSQPSFADHVGQPARGWIDTFQTARVMVDELATSKSQKAKETKIGNFLSLHVGRRVPIVGQGRTGTAELCVAENARKVKRYFFRVVWDGGEDSILPEDTSPQEAGLAEDICPNESADGSAPENAFSDDGGNQECW